MITIKRRKRVAHTASEAMAYATAIVHLVATNYKMSANGVTNPMSAKDSLARSAFARLLYCDTVLSVAAIAEILKLSARETERIIDRADLSEKDQNERVARCASIRAALQHHLNTRGVIRRLK